MDRLYSPFLLLSLVTGSLALALVLGSRVGRFPTWTPRWLRHDTGARCAGLLVTVSLASLALSAVVHLAWGHRPGSPEALGLAAFLRVHPSFPVAAALPLLAVLLRRSA